MRFIVSQFVLIKKLVEILNNKIMNQSLIQTNNNESITNPDQQDKHIVLKSQRKA